MIDLNNILGAASPLAFLGGASSPVQTTYTPDGEYLETLSVRLPLVTGEVDWMDDGGMPPLVQLGGQGGSQNIGEGLGGRSVESVDVDGPLDLGLDALFNLNDSQNTESGVNIGNGLLTALVADGFAPSSLQSVGATGPFGIDLDALFDSGTGSALTSLASVFDGNLVAAGLLDGPGGRLDTLSLDGPLQALIEMGDGGDTGFPIEIGDGSFIAASLLDNLSNTGLETFDIGFGSIGGLGGINLDGLLDGILS